jgi:predicted CopG family antitoxin
MHVVKTVKINDEAHKLLIDVGSKSETFSDVIIRVVEHYKKCPKK